MNTSHQTDRSSLSSSLVGALIASLITLMPVTAQPAAATIDKTQITFSNGVCDLPAAGYSGTGTSANPYLISDSAALWESVDCGTGIGVFFTLTNNIDLEGAIDAPTHSPIGFTASGTSRQFQGVFDGSNFSIDNISTSNSLGNAGLFWKFGTVNFRNLTISGQVQYIGSDVSHYTGGLVGEAASGTFSAITNFVTISGRERVGGFVGFVANYATFSEVINRGNVSGLSAIGGIVGRAQITHISECHNFGEVRSSTSRGGGLVGQTSLGRGVIRESSNRGLVSVATGDSGGIVGFSDTSLLNIENSQNHGTIMASGGSYMGGLVGYSARQLTVSGSLNTGNVSGAAASGGLIGGVVTGTGASLNVASSTNSGIVSTANGTSGGIVGFSEVNVTLNRVTNTGVISASGKAKVGGLVGQVSSIVTVSNSLNSGTVFSSDSSGGIIGWIVDSSRVRIFSSTNQGFLQSSGVRVAGFVGGSGTNVQVAIHDSTNSADVYAMGSNVAGVIGSADTGTIVTLSNVINTGEITGSERVAGLAGSMQSISVDNSHNSGQINATATNGREAGGLIGRASSASRILSSQNSGTISSVVTNFGYTGGLIGRASESTLIYQSFNSGLVMGKSHTSGILGIAGSVTTMSFVFNTGRVDGTNYVSGLLSEAIGSLSISNSYNIGQVSGSNFVSGLVGRASLSAQIENSYSTGTFSAAASADPYVSTVSSAATANLVSVYSLFNSGFAASSSLAEMQSVSLFTGWDFATIWGFGECSENDGLPMLRFANLVSTYYLTGCYTAPVTPAATQSPTVSSESVAASPEQSPQPYRGPKIFAFLQPANAGSVVIFDGIRLVGISYVGLGEIAVSYSVASSISLSVVVPTALAPSEYDLVVLSTEGKLTVVRALKVIEPVVSIPGPVLSDRAKTLLGKTQALPKFQRGQQGISSNQANWLKDRLEGSGLSKIVCTGVIQQSMTMHQKIQIRMRAMQACLEAKQYLPNASVSHQSKLSTNRQSVARVLVSFQG